MQSRNRPDDRFGPVSQAQVRKIMMGADRFEIGDEVAVNITGLSRPLYGTVVEFLDNTRTRVHVRGSRGEATIEVDTALLTPWRSR